MSPAISSTPAFKQAPINLQTFEEDRISIRTIPELIEFNAEHNPSQLFCLQGTRATQNVPETLQVSVSHLQLKHAILRCSARLIAEVAEIKVPSKIDGGKFVKCQPVALFVDSDVGLLIHLFALMSLGIPVSLLPRFQCHEALVD